MTITEQVAKNIIKKLLRGKDYRIEVVTLINAEFLQFAIDFFKKIVDAKLKNKNITVDWYKKEFLNPNLPARDIAINSGLNKKTIHNMFNSSTKEIVINAANEHYDTLYEAIKNLVDNENDFEREIDFYLVEGKNQYKCEVKLMGRGNPESADAVIARDSKVFVADKLSETNKKQLSSLDVEWVELRSDKGFQRFETVLNNLKIPHRKLPDNIDKELEIIFQAIFN